MIATSYGQNKFWNKKNSFVFDITAPKSLQVYFGKNHEKMSIGHLSINRQINQVSSDDSLPCVLQKKIRGVKLCPNSVNVLQKPIYFIDKKNGNKFSITVEQLFNYFVEYRQGIRKITISDKLRETIIKPFVRLYWHITSNQLAISSRQQTMGRDLNKIFVWVLKEGEIIDKGQQGVEEQLRNKNIKIVEEADKILKTIQKKEWENFEQDKKSRVTTTYNNIKSSKTLQRTEKHLKTGHSIGTQPILESKKVIIKTGKKIKFKNLNAHENDDSEEDEDDTEDLCYELGLLISDTDRILKPIDQDLLN